MLILPITTRHSRFAEREQSALHSVFVSLQHLHPEITGRSRLGSSLLRNAQRKTSTGPAKPQKPRLRKPDAARTKLVVRLDVSAEGFSSEDLTEILKAEGAEVPKRWHNHPALVVFGGLLWHMSGKHGPSREPYAFLKSSISVLHPALADTTAVLCCVSALDSVAKSTGSKTPGTVAAMTELQISLPTEEAAAEVRYLLGYKPEMPAVDRPARIGEAAAWLEESALMLQKALRPYASVAIARTAGDQPTLAQQFATEFEEATADRCLAAYLEQLNRARLWTRFE